MSSHISRRQSQELSHPKFDSKLDNIIRTASVVIRTLWRLTLIAIIALNDARFAAADDDDDLAASALHAGNDIPWSKMTVKILDPEGNPLTGATVRPWALRAGNAHGWWNDKTYGAPKKTTTDATGATTVVFPQAVAWGLKDKHNVIQVSMIIDHPDFCSKNEHVNVPVGDPPNIPEVRLERGFRLRFAGVAAGSDQPLPHCHAMLENGDVAGPEFVPDKDGWLQSVPIRGDRRWFRVVYLPPDGTTQFSRPMAWNPDDPQSREAKIEVRPGVRVKGVIDDSVQRPIERGHVVAVCGSPIQRDAVKGKHVSPIWWNETVPIAADGTFEFPSLPSGYLAQFYAYANDSISAQPSHEAFNTCCKWFSVENPQRIEIFRYGQILRLAGAESRIMLEMEPGGAVRVKCIDSAGKPLRGIEISSWPNQLMIGGGSTILCGKRSSKDGLLGDPRTDWWRDNPFVMDTNADGEVTIRNLPAGKQEFYATNDHWGGNDGEQATSEPGETKVIEMKLERIH